MSLDEAERCIHDAFVSAAERQIQVGDAIHFKIVTKNGIEEKTVALRKDWAVPSITCCFLELILSGVFLF